MPLPDPDELLRQWEEGRGTGTCFEIVAAFSRLLTALGYQVIRVPGMTSSFMGGHQAIIVAFGQDRYLVDVATGAPFFEPIRVDRVVEVRHAGLAYRFRPGGEQGEFLQEHWRDEAWTRFCRYELRDLDDVERGAAYHRLHEPSTGSLIGVLRLVRCTRTAVYSLRTAELTRFTNQGRHTERLEGPRDYERAVTEVFDLPRLPILGALAVLKALDSVT